MDSATQAQVFTSKSDSLEGQEAILTASDLASILKWSKDISSDINLSSGQCSQEIWYGMHLTFVISIAAAYGNCDGDLRVSQYVR